MNTTFTYLNTGLKEIPVIQLTRLHYNGDVSNVSIQVHDNNAWLDVSGPGINCCAVMAKIIHPVDLRAYASPKTLENLHIITFCIKGSVYSYAIGVCSEGLEIALKDYIKPALQRLVESDYNIDPDNLIDRAIGEYFDL